MEESTAVKAGGVAKIAALYDLGASTVRRAIRDGQLKVSRVGRKIVIRIVDVEKWLARSR